MEDAVAGDAGTWYSNETATFGDRLAGAREAVGLSQDDLARKLGVTLKTLRAWEEDLAEPRANRLQMLAGLLNVSFTWLLTGEGEGLPDPDDTVALSGDVKEIMTEFRQIGGELHRAAERLGLLEKRLRKLVSESAE